MHVINYGIKTTITASDGKLKDEIAKARAAFADVPELESRAEFLTSVYGRQRGIQVFHYQLSEKECMSVSCSITMQMYAENLRNLVDSMVLTHWRL